MFINRKRSQCKILYFDRSGYCLWSKRLEQGQFHTHTGTALKHPLEWTDLKLILEGIYTRTVRHYKRYRHSPSKA